MEHLRTPTRLRANAAEAFSISRSQHVQYAFGAAALQHRCCVRNEGRASLCCETTHIRQSFSTESMDA